MNEVNLPAMRLKVAKPYLKVSFNPSTLGYLTPNTMATKSGIEHSPQISTFCWMILNCMITSRTALIKTLREIYTEFGQDIHICVIQDEQDLW